MARYNAKNHFRRAARIYFITAAVLFALGAFYAPDGLGRGIAAVIAAVMVVIGVSRLRDMGRVSDRAEVQEELVGRRVRVIVSDPGPNALDET